MKKLLFVLPIIIFTLCSCTKKSPDVTAVATGLSFTAEIKQGKKDYVYDVVIDKNGAMTLKSQDDKKLSFYFCGNTLNKRYDDIEFSSTVSSVAKNDTCDLLFDVFSDVKTNRSIYTKNNRYYQKGETQKYSYTLHITKSGIPLKLEESRFGITVLFKKANLQT